MLFENSQITLGEFLADYWQKKPLLLRQAFPDFEPELDADDIAGLACDELAESRLIFGSFPEQDWYLRYGPFSDSDFSELPESRWTLLVQDVEKHYPPLRRLLDEFSFLPRWRIDDLMVSVAAHGGSVGPHVDRYDVFLLQAQGRRHWHIAESFNGELLEDCELNVLKSFDSEQDWVLEAGDMLYLPPGIAHHGIAVGQCMTWSIGLRAPSAADLFQSYGEWLAERHGEGLRYRDPEAIAPQRKGEIDSGAVSQFQKLARSYLTGSDDYLNFLGCFLSRFRLANEPAPPPQAHHPDALQQALKSGKSLQANPWTRLLWTSTQSGALLFAAGNSYACSESTAMIICDPASLEQHAADLMATDGKLLCELLNHGHLFLA